MARLEWGLPGERYFEAGIDRGVLYLEGQDGVPWNGLTAVSEEPDGGQPRPYYLDGFKYLNVASSEEYNATITAFSSPREFGECDGTLSIGNGLFVTQQPRRTFGLSYRTMVGNDVGGVELGYKIHLVYNALAGPTTKENSTLGDSTEPISMTWGISTMPPEMSGYRPTSHMIIDSRVTPPALLKEIEDILYGSDSSSSRLPEVTEIMTIFSTPTP